MRRVAGRGGQGVPAILAMACVLTLAVLAARGAAVEVEGEGSAPPGETQPAPSEAPAGAAEAQPAPQPPEAPPRIIRVVCTDHICGNCDGKCHRDSGHVAVDKKGHCACTPTEGGALDRATRLAYEKNPPK